MKEQLQKLEGKLIKVVHTDGDQTAYTTGRLISISDDAICLETLRNILIISLSCIQKVKTSLNNDQGGQSHEF